MFDTSSNIINISNRFLLLIGMLFFFQSISVAQNISVILIEPELTILTAFKEIEKQTGYIFAVNNSHFDTSRKIRIHKRNFDLNELLNIMLTGSDHEYVIINRHIILVPPKIEVVPVIEDTLVNTQDTIIHDTLESETGKPENKWVWIPQPVTDDNDILDEREVTNAPVSQFDMTGNLLMAGNRTDTFSIFPSTAPEILIKTNLLYAGIALTPNLGIEVGLSRKTSINVSASYRFWGREGKYLDNRKLVHWICMSEYRYWFDKRFHGHFLGFHAFYFQYNISEYKIPLLFEKDYRYDGFAYGGGLSYGYQYILNKKWRVEFNAGFGIANVVYDRYKCSKCTDKLDSKSKTYFGPTRAGISLIYTLK